MKRKISRGEKRIHNFLRKNNIKFEMEKRFPDCRHKKPLPFDVYLPEYDICIEFDGPQHSKVVQFPQMTAEYADIYHQNIVHRDQIKNEWCKQTGRQLYRIDYKEKANTELILEQMCKDHNIVRRLSPTGENNLLNFFN